MTLTFLALVAAVYLALVGGLYTFQRNLLYLPSTATPLPASYGVADMEVVGLRTADGLDLAAWYRPAEANRPTIVYFHGNGGHIGYRGAKVRPYLDAGFGMLLAEYRGYGGNPGAPNEEGLYHDGRAALGFLAGQGVPPERIALYGESLGSAVAVRIAAEQARASRPVAALVLEAPLSSVTDVAAYHYPWVPVGWLLKDRFESTAMIGEVRAPVLVVHGEADDVVPIRFGRALFDAARQPKQALWVPRAGHEDLDDFGAHRAVMEFLDRWAVTGD